VAALAQVVQTAIGTSIGNSTTIEPVLRQGNLPLSFAQQRLWFLDRLYPGSPIYNLPMGVRLSGELNAMRFEQTFNEVIRRHEVLRTRFDSSDGQPLQVILPAAILAARIVDISELDSQEREIQVRRLADEENRQPFDLRQFPLMRVTLLRLDRQDHAVLITMHHIISDGWSMDVFTRETAALNQAFSNGEPSPLSELQIQYVDFADWQRKRIQGEFLQAEIDYWKSELSEIPRILNLPTDRPRTPVKSSKGAQQSIVLDETLCRELKALGNREGATLFMALLAAFSSLLYRYAREEDIIVGTPIANRNWIEIEGLIGFFLNTLVLRSNFSGNPCFRELLGRVREGTLRAHTHQDIPFEKIVEVLSPERDTTHSPLFQVMFVFQNASAKAADLPGLGSDQLATSGGASKFDLTLSMRQIGPQIIGSLSYNPDLFDSPTIVRMLSHLRGLLEGVVAGAGREISLLPLLTEAEHHQLLVEWGRTPANYDLGECIHELIERQAEKTPESIAVVFEETQISLGELNRRANQLGRYLRSLRVKPETHVAICLERSPEMVICVLATLKAGGAYLPIDPAYPAQRTIFMLEDARAEVILTRRSILDASANHTAVVLDIETDWEIIAKEGEMNFSSGICAEQPAYVIYTSGSTGRPKGVVIEHRQIVNYFRAITDHLAITPGATFAMVQPLTVDSCKTVLLPPLCAGGSLHVISEDRSVDPDGLARYFVRHQIDCLKIAPSHLMALQNSARPEQILPQRWLIVGGEASTWEQAERVQSMAPDCSVFNHYGPTEATVGILTFPLREGHSRHHSSSVPIGRPLPNTEAYLVGRRLELLPSGVPGEMHVGGHCLARGYLNRPDLTAEKFIPDQFCDAAGARAYTTGDLVRMLPDGHIEFLGRTDDQVKIRGFRVELKEIEARRCV
jgi:amino acid adenylation domain-containing protein